MKTKSKHQAAEVQIVDLGNRLAYQGKCRCGWFCTFLRSTRESAAHDTQDHIAEGMRR